MPRYQFLHLEVCPLPVGRHSRQHHGHPPGAFEAQHVGVVQDPG